MIMSTRMDRGWMYRRMDNDGYLSSDYCIAVDEFLNFAFSQQRSVERKIVGRDVVLRIKCPCRSCKIKHYKERDDVKLHLCQYGFIADYTTWWAHGERESRFQHEGQCSNTMEDDEVDGCTRMVLEAMAPAVRNPATVHSNTWEEQVPNPAAKGFYDMLQAADEPLWEGCQSYSRLQAATRLLNWKSECNVPDATYNRILPIFKEMLPDGDKLVENFYETKKSLKKMSLPKIKIHACKNHCMLFYGETSSLTNCVVCGECRYKAGGRNNVPNLVLTYLPIAPRLQRLYMSKRTAKEMTWHYDHRTQPGLMVHPSDGMAWKHFDSNHPAFANEIRNVRLGLCTDGFNPNNSNSNPYSLWPVFLTIYNLPPWMGLKESYVKLSMVIPGRKSPGQNLDVFLRPLVDELKMLFTDGVDTYDAYRKNNFTMRVVLLWTVSDFSTYAMLSG